MCIQRYCWLFLFMCCFLPNALSSLAFAAPDNSMWTNLGIYGGQIKDLAVDPQNPDRMFASTYNGRGLYFTQDGGASWQALEMANGLLEGEDTLDEQAVFVVATSPVDADILWVGHNFWVAKSLDGGKTWTHISNSIMQRDCTDCGGSGDDFRFCTSIAVHPCNSNYVIVGTSGVQGSNVGGAVYATTDGGKTWTKLNQGKDLDYGVEALALIRGYPDTIWVATNSKGHGGVYDGTIYSSKDNGQTFSSTLPKPDTGGIFSVAPKPGDLDTVFVACDNGIVQLHNDGDQWNASNPVPDSRMATDVVFAPSNANIIYASWRNPMDRGGDGKTKISRGVYDHNTNDWTWQTYVPDQDDLAGFNCLAVHPAEADILMGGDSSLGVFISRDSGQNWTPINQGLDAVIVYDVDVETGNTVHMLAASGSGLFERPDADSSWIRRRNGEFTAVRFVPSSGSAYLGGGHGFVYRTTNNGADWSLSSYLGDVYALDIAVDPVNEDRVYIATGQNGCQVLRSSDGAATFEAVLDGVNQAGDAYNMNKVVIDPHEHRHIFAAGGNFNVPEVPGDLWQSFDGGDTWQRTGLTDTVVNALLVDPRDPAVLYAGCGFSRNDSEPLLKSHDGGLTWQAASAGLPGGRRPLNDIWAAPGEDRPYAVGSRGVIIHYNGKSWESEPSNTLSTLHGIHGLSADNIYAVGENGTIIHFDGQSWQPMTSNTTNTLYGVWAADGDHVFAVGEAGTIMQYDGSAWTQVPSLTTVPLIDVRGLAANNVYAVGEKGTTRHYDGSSWAWMPTGTMTSLHAVWPVSSDDVFDAYRVGDGGLILHFDRNDWEWHTMPSNTTGDLWAIWASGSNNMYAAGPAGDLLHFNGQQWDRIEFDTRHVFKDIWGTAPDRLYLTDSLDGIWLYNGRELIAVREQGTYNRSVTDLALHHDDPDSLYAATLKAGIYISPDQATNWLNLGTPIDNVYALASGSLYAGTGSGMYKLTGTGVLAGDINDAKTLQGIDNASVTTDLGQQCRSAGGLYMMVLPSGLFDVKARADDYGQASAKDVMVGGSEVTRLNFALAPGGEDPDPNSDSDQEPDQGQESDPDSDPDPDSGSDPNPDLSPGDHHNSDSTGYCFVGTLHYQP